MQGIDIRREMLTGLPSQYQLVHDLGPDSTFKIYSLAVMSVIDFVEMNDFHGPLAGDKLLKAVAARLMTVVDEDNPDWCLYKLPREEFALASTVHIDKQKFIKRLETCIEIIEVKDLEFDDYSAHLHVIAGLSYADLAPDEIHHGPYALLTQANMALFEASNSMRHYCEYRSDISSQQRLRHNMEWAKQLKSAIRDQRIIPYYQPIVSLPEGKITGVEVLARLVTDTGEVALPEAFIEVAKRTRWYPLLTRMVFAQAAQTLRDTPYKMSFNISVEDIHNDETLNFFITTIQENNLIDQVQFELIETEAVGDYDDVIQFFQKLKEFKCQLAIDDFGYGYSNFGKIIRLDPDNIKFDGTLVRESIENLKIRLLLETVINLSKKLNIQTTAEYVDSQAVLDLVCELGVDFGQGFYIGKPKAALPVD
jgi:EAL domain-containing protein (putative c-di-GMP-specific phosphodiesterase class I)/GGDEF domain-containing protein